MERSLETLKERLWQITRKVCFKVYGTDCFTCPSRNLEGGNLQCGHMWLDSTLGNDMAYELGILRPQCASCNLYHNGKPKLFYEKVLARIGKKRMAQLEKRRQLSKTANVKADRLWFIKKIEEYERLYASL